jgi:hypothetical protein
MRPRFVALRHRLDADRYRLNADHYRLDTDHYRLDADHYRFDRCPVAGARDAARFGKSQGKMTAFKWNNRHSSLG